MSTHFAGLVRPTDVKFLCLTAIPCAVDAELAAAVAGADEVVARLDRFAAAGLGSWESPDGSYRLFRYRDDIRADALDLVRRRWRSDFRRASHDAALWYLTTGDTTAAMRHAMSSESPNLIGHLALRLTPDPRVSADQLLEGVARLPDAYIRDSAALSLWVALMHARSARPGKDAVSYFRSAAAAARTHPTTLSASEKLVLAGIEACALQRSGDATRAMIAAHRFRDEMDVLIDSRRFDASLVHSLAAIAYEVGTSLVDLREYSLAMRVFELLEQLCAIWDVAYRRPAALGGMAYIEALGGRTRTASALLASIGEHAYDDNGLQADPQCFIGMSRILLSLVTADDAALRDALGRLPADGRIQRDARLLGDIALDLYERGLPAAVMRYETHLADLAAMPSRTSSTPVLVVITMLLRALGAEHIAAIPAKKSSRDTPLVMALRASIEIDRGSCDAAAVLLAEASARSTDPLVDHVVFVALARLAHAQGDTTSLHQATLNLALVEDRDRIRIAFCLLTPEERRAMLATIENPGRFADAMNAVPPRKSTAESTAPPRLTKKEIEVITALSKLGDRDAVAKSLVLTPATVKVHLRAIYRKLDAHSEAEALYKAAAAGFLTRSRLRE